ncbi:hypothetical protein HYX04_03685 [Candidatus Woesearchaeota archaeon]|nr:hypothetical protein [Candidatus Woesearchaeota archaeon]
MPWTAFNDYSRPGFSVYPVFGKTSEGIDSLLVTIHDELKKQGNPHWALSEGSDLSGEMSPETYLASLFNYGASLVNIFGWEIPENAGDMFGANAGKVARSSDSIAAYKKFLNGEKLLIGGSTETNAGGNATPTASGAFDAKIQKIQGNLGKWLAQNPGRQAEINSLIEKMNQYAKDGKQKDAEGVADEILGMIGAE